MRSTVFYIAVVFHRNEDVAVAMDATVLWRCEPRAAECLLGRKEALT